MNRAEFVFALIDVLCHPTQNYISKKNIECVKDISYDDTHKECKLDVYYRKTDEKMPVIFNIHGGGFVKGDKKHRKSLAHLYADQGWFVVNINYRLAPKAPFPSIAEDCLHAVDYLHTLAKDYNIDLDKVVITGDSSGAYSATYTTDLLTNPELRERLNLPDVGIKPAGLISFCGVYDLIAALDMKIPFGIVRSVAESFLGFKFNKDYSNKSEYRYLAEVSPTNWVNANFPKTLITMAQQDFFCKGQGEILYARLKELGVDVKEIHSTKFMDNHCYHFNFWTKASKDTMAEVYKFLSEIKNGDTAKNAAE